MLRPSTNHSVGRTERRVGDCHGPAMIHPETLRILFVALALSAVAPLVLLLYGVADMDLLLVVFSPSALVGMVAAAYARRRSLPRAWLFDSQRMP